MPRSILTPESPLEARVAELERLVGDLAAARRIGDTSQRGGTFALLDDDGNALVEFGDFTDPNDTDGYGLAIRDQAGNPVLATYGTESGLAWPGDNTAWVTTTPQNITSGTFADYHAVRLYQLTGDTLLLGGTITCPVGTTAEVRIRYADPVTFATLYTNTATITSSETRWAATWLHPFPVGWQAGAFLYAPLYLEVRRASGAGTVVLYHPNTCAVSSSKVVPTATDTNPVVAVA